MLQYAYTLSSSMLMIQHLHICWTNLQYQGRHSLKCLSIFLSMKKKKTSQCSNNVNCVNALELFVKYMYIVCIVTFSCLILICWPSRYCPLDYWTIAIGLQKTLLVVERRRWNNYDDNKHPFIACSCFGILCF